jgi:TonB-linked SusC/RagA family outer membrane protein
MTKKILVLIVFITAISLQVFAQSVKGKVTSSVDGTTLPGVTVSVKGGSGATITDGDGNYSISTGSSSTLVFTYVGFKTMEVAVANRSTVDVILDEDNTQLDEVVVTALGIQREKKSLGYAVQELKGTQLVEARENNVTNAFSGKVAGLQVVRSSTGAGGSSKIVLRGNTSLTGNNQPLIVVDGIPIDNFTGGTSDYWNATFDYGNGLGDVNPEDIQSISVLKGPSAAALYGSRAGNGVILITTKGGLKQPGLGLTFTTTLGTENIFMKPERQTSFGQGDNNIFDAMSNNSWGPKISGQSVKKWDGTQSTLQSHDNVNEFLRTGSTQNYGLALQQQFGGTGVYSSVNYLEDRSIIPGNKLTRLNFSTRATSSFGAENRWKSDVKISYNNTSGFNRPINGRDRSSLYALYTMPTSLNIADFSAATDQFGKMLWYPGAVAWVPNPYWAYQYDTNQDSRNRFVMSGSLKYAFTDWLDAEVKAGADHYNTENERKSYAGGSLNNGNSAYSTGKISFTEVNYTGLIRAVKDNVIGKIGGNLTLGGNLMEQKYNSLSISTGSLEVPNLFSPTNSQDNPVISPSYSGKKINSVFASAGVNYDGYLFFDVTARNDWSSAMIAANRSYFYPSYSLAYVLSDHLDKAGKPLPSWLSYTKLRASYATVGNDLAPYMLYNGYSIGKDQIGQTVASRQTLLKDPNVRSELIKNLEFGAELRFLRDRLSLDFTWYKSNATRQLLDIPMDPLSGFTNRKINAGNIQNKGFEIMASANILTNPNKLAWTITANFSKNENRIIDLASDLNINTYNIGVFDDLFVRATTDGLYGEIYGTKFLRVKDKSSPHYGQMILTGEGLPQRDSEIQKLGSQQAKGLIGITNSFRYKDFGLSFLIDARLGGEIFSASNVGLQRYGIAAVTAPGGERPEMVVDGVVAGADGSYTKNTSSITQQQYWNSVGTLGNLGIGEANIYDATNVRLRNVSLSYNLPKKALGGVFQNAKASLSCNNVWMIKSHLNGIDPESVFATGSNAVGVESGAFPTMRSVLLSLSFGF